MQNINVHRAEEEASYLVVVRHESSIGVWHANDGGRALCAAGLQGASAGTENRRGTWTEMRRSGLPTEELCVHCQRRMSEIRLYAFLCGLTLAIAQARCKTQEALLMQAIEPTYSPRSFVM